MKPGELAALVAGPHQATAVARTAVGLARPLAGRVLVGRRDVTDAPPGDRQIGYVPANDGLLPSLSVQRNIWYGIPSRVRGDRLVSDRWFGLAQWPRGDRLAHDVVERLTTALDLGPTLHLRPHELDDGLRFHAAVVRAVACMHEVVVVDLPRPVPGALDLQDILRRIRAAVESTVIMAVVVCTPDPGAAGTVDRVVRGSIGPTPDSPGAGR